MENAIQRVLDQARVVKLDIELNMKLNVHPSHQAWPWLAEYVAQTMLLYKVNAVDGLTAIQRIRGLSRATQKGKIRSAGSLLYPRGRQN